MSIHLPTDIEQSIRERVESGFYVDEADVVRKALRLLEIREQRFQELKDSIQEGLDSIDRGEGIEVTAQFWVELDREVDERLARGDKPSPDVCP